MDSTGTERGDLRTRRRFIVWRGIVGWGLGTAVLWSAAMAWWSDGPFWAYLVPAVALFPIGGWFWGAAMWRASQKG